ncbi:MAG: VWA domain-containing protein [Corynebacterium casei]|uniref:VWFA domain-containing protein n=2 Tax=Corynebacterium casei TaxID=160386 RepID=G7HZG2_9CORY|nr:VWA domain-containing protein [Corynebacterium casei]AHI20121.1 hypothetical protein CCASEI_07760 [Corynebacterium casei LMG S-19264]MDN5799922.1 VWA domain-containing protein [Corynebacterium casei]MDN5923225.1 VWA domain-containing protein [Corynebacterium casei]MDN6285340.1 VWA domain-containing protein [Corynebacterium casei]MDN6312753.1 VWA domain-containing protein [Corynebacterium casei]
MKKLVTAVMVFLSGIILVACGSMGGIFDFGLNFGGVGGGSGDGDDGASSSADPLVIAAATELEDLEPAIAVASADLGFDIQMEFPDGTLANTQQLAQGNFDGRYDATWFATNRYVTIENAGDKLADETSIARSPVALGVKADVAESKGWTYSPPSWQEIAASGVSFGMTDPATSNSGFSALASVSTAMADTGNAIVEADIQRVSPQVRGFFSNQTLTSGSSGWLADVFLDDPNKADAIINYESVLHSLKSEGADIEVIIPNDGVISADYPLSTLANPLHDGAQDQVEQLVSWFEDNPEELTGSYRRLNNGEHDPQLQDSGVYELPFPASKDVVAALVNAYSNQLRNPGETAFVLDISGSMEGERFDLLTETMHSLIDGSAATTTGNVGFRDRETITLAPFATEPYYPTTVTYSVDDPATHAELSNRVDRFNPIGYTAIYDALAMTMNTIGANDDAIPSVVLMTDGENTSGRSYEEFKQYYDGLSAEKQQIPVFVILYGEADVAELSELADYTGGRVFDALEGDLNEVFKEIRAYQ